VQGVGFRPFIYRTAHRHQLKGSVENRNDGVHILVQGHRSDIDAFLQSIHLEKPEASTIHSIHTVWVQDGSYGDFLILPSSNDSKEITQVSPDIAVCHECLSDLKHQKHRLDYPFINCTNCGPRFTIIQDLPYDRSQTTMSPFEMCSKCRSEYEDVMNRRFHAQPVACNDCGPQYVLHTSGGIRKDLTDILTKLISILEHGGTAAIKGIGGYFLACDATNSEAVEKIRRIKVRESKPFAVLFSHLDAVREYNNLSDAEEALLTSWKRPIVLLNARKKLAPGVSMGFPTIGAMLPYMPFHYLLFQRTHLKALVLTSGNISEEPIIIDDRQAIDTFGTRCDAVLTYNRRIENRVDDSVTMVVGTTERLLRRSRGYVPSPIFLKTNVNGIIAAGAELVNCFCVGKGHQAFMSQHIGDLKNLETYDFYTESLARFNRLFRVEPQMVVCDMHPDYLSTRFAENSGLDLLQVQHHHAHIASCMAEYGLDEDVIGIAFDGIGLGDDGAIWGGEFLKSDLSSYERFTHFDYVPMPGGDAATFHPWRMAVAYLHRIYAGDLRSLDIPFLREITDPHFQTVIQMIEKGIHSPLTSSVGRLFDAVSAMLGLCRAPAFHAEAPMRLEAAISDGFDGHYDVEFSPTIAVDRMFEQLVRDIQNKVAVGVIARKFHQTMVFIIERVATTMRDQYGLNKVVLSGGTFQNRYLLCQAEHRLRALKFDIYFPRDVPCNDGGIALGQLAIASKKRESNS